MQTQEDAIMPHRASKKKTLDIIFEFEKCTRVTESL